MILLARITSRARQAKTCLGIAIVKEELSNPDRGFEEPVYVDDLGHSNHRRFAARNEYTSANSIGTG
jgi:hypothetical protein